MSKLFNRRIIMKLLSVAAAYFGLDWMGWNGSEPADVGNVTVPNPEAIKYVLSAVAFFLPDGFKALAPGIVAWLNKQIDRAKGVVQDAVDGEEDGLIPVPSSDRDRLTCTLKNLRSLKSEMAGDERALQLISELAPLVWERLTQPVELIDAKKA